MRIEVAGRTLTVRSDAPEARVNAVVDYVNAQIEQLKDKSVAVSSEQVVLLVALNMAEELFSVRDQYQALKDRVKDRGQRLLTTLDQIAREPLPDDDRGPQ